MSGGFGKQGFSKREERKHVVVFLLGRALTLLLYGLFAPFNTSIGQILMPIPINASFSIPVLQTEYAQQLTK